MKFYSTKPQKETCVLIGLVTPRDNKSHVQDNLDELSALVLTAGGKVQQRYIQSRNAYDPAYFIGKGKAEEISSYIKLNPVDTLIFDDELTPAQVRNWEQLVNKKVIDRSALILDIFAAHARSREARLQVELAQLTYLLPRLTRQWSHLSRQVGGIGTKGPGESQLETDRRLVRHRISHLEKDLKRIEQQGKTQRKNAGFMKRVSLVGYTNTGKSTLLHALTGAEVLIADKLFATLDTTTRRLRLNDQITILISDTVGFINKLPHHLIASFQSTLAQTREADLLLHIVDLSDPSYVDHIKIVQDILKELDIQKKPTIIIFNKVDKVRDEQVINAAVRNYPKALFVSATKKIRLQNIKKRLAKRIAHKSSL
jgi:GTP-binding protein HflX